MPVPAREYVAYSQFSEYQIIAPFFELSTYSYLYTLLYLFSEEISRDILNETGLLPDHIWQGLKTTTISSLPGYISLYLAIRQSDWQLSGKTIWILYHTLHNIFMGLAFYQAISPILEHKVILHRLLLSNPISCDHDEFQINDPIYSLSIMQDPTTLCPCGSGATYTKCCEVYHLGTAAPTAEKLMRSRFTAYALNNTDYLVQTTWPVQQPALNEQEIYSRADNTCWTRLEIVDTQKGQTEDAAGVVEFKAMFTTPAELQEQTYHERSDFIKENGRWYFIYPNLSRTPVTSQQPGRNDPCPCGSGKKFKKCCMNK